MKFARTTCPFPRTGDVSKQIYVINGSRLAGYNTITSYVCSIDLFNIVNMLDISDVTCYVNMCHACTLNCKAPVFTSVTAQMQHRLIGEELRMARRNTHIYNVYIIFACMPCMHHDAGMNFNQAVQLLHLPWYVLYQALFWRWVACGDNLKLMLQPKHM